MGLGHVAMAFVSAEAARTGFGPFVLNAQAPDEGNMHTLLHYANDEQKEKYLRPLAEGRSRSCFAMTEPEVAGSDPTGIQHDGRAGRRRLGDQRPQVVHLAARKGARFAILIARTDPDADPPQARNSAFLVDLPARRLGDRARHRHDGRPRQPLRDPHHRPARAGARTCSASAGTVTCSASPPRPGAARALHALDRQRRDRRSRCSSTARWSASSHGSLLADKQAIQWMMAESAMELYAGKLMVLHAAYKIENEHAVQARRCRWRSTTSRTRSGRSSTARSRCTARSATRRTRRSSG